MKLRLKAAAFLMCFSGVVTAQGIPTIDQAAIVQFIEQINHMKVQIDNQLAQIKSLTESFERGSIGVNRSATIDNRIPSEWEDIYNLADIDLSAVKSPNDFDPDANLKNLTAVYKNTKIAFSDTQARLDTINELMATIDATTGVKDAADLQNRIATEQALIANNQVKLDQLSRMYELQKDMIYQKKSVYDSCILRNRDNPSVCE